MPEQVLLGYMYIAKRPCGRTSASAWDDADAKKDTAKSVARWIARGDSVERIARFKGDPLPAVVCQDNEACACRESKTKPAPKGA